MIQQHQTNWLGRLKLNVCFASTDSGYWTHLRKHNTTRRNLHKLYLKTIIEGLYKDIKIVCFLPNSWMMNARADAKHTINFKRPYR